MATPTLQERANELYDKHYSTDAWLTEFSLKELAQLWYYECVYRQDANGNVTGGACYDDEVYDALAVLGFFEDKKVKEF